MDDASSYNSILKPQGAESGCAGKKDDAAQKCAANFSWPDQKIGKFFQFWCQLHNDSNSVQLNVLFDFLQWCLCLNGFEWYESPGGIRYGREVSSVLVMKYIDVKGLAKILLHEAQE